MNHNFNHILTQAFKNQLIATQATQKQAKVTDSLHFYNGSEILQQLFVEALQYANNV